MKNFNDLRETQKEAILLAVIGATLKKLLYDFDTDNIPQNIVYDFGMLVEGHHPADPKPFPQDIRDRIHKRMVKALKVFAQELVGQSTYSENAAFNFYLENWISAIGNSRPTTYLIPEDYKE